MPTWHRYISLDINLRTVNLCIFFIRYFNPKLFVWFLFFKTVIENIENTILILSENCYYLNLMFSMFSLFSKKKMEPNMFFLVLLVFENKECTKGANKHNQKRNCTKTLHQWVPFQSIKATIESTFLSISIFTQSHRLYRKDCLGLWKLSPLSWKAFKNIRFWFIHSIYHLGLDGIKLDWCFNDINAFYEKKMDWCCKTFWNGH